MHMAFSGRIGGSSSRKLFGYGTTLLFYLSRQHILQLCGQSFDDIGNSDLGLH